MKVTYAPAGEPVQVFDFNPDKVRVAEAELIEKRFGGTFQEFRAAVTSGNAKARRVLLWHLVRRTHHTLRYEDTPDFQFGELVCEHTRGELEAMRDRIVRSNHARRDELVAALELEMQDAPDEESGKAPSGSDGSSA